MQDSSLCRAVTPRLRLLQLLLLDCINLLQLLLPIASASTAPRLRPLRLLLPNCVRFNCCFPIVSLVVPAVLEDSSRCMPNVLKHPSRSLRFKYEGHASLVESSPAPRTSHFCHTHTHTHTGTHTHARARTHTHTHPRARARTHTHTQNGDHDSMSCCLSLGCLDCLSSRNSDLMLSLLSLSFSSRCIF